MGASVSANHRKNTTPKPAESTSQTTGAAATTKGPQQQYPVLGPNDIMRKKRHGTSDHPVQESLRWGVSRQKADQICNYNRHYAEPSGSAFRNMKYLAEVKEAAAATTNKRRTIKFYDSNTGHLLFEAPKGGRTIRQFDQESRAHGWPSFRDDEVNWDHVRCLKNGECVSLDGTHLGHNLPDRKGNRYCINLVSVAGLPVVGGDNKP